MDEAYWSWLVKNPPEDPLVSVSVLSDDAAGPSVFCFICEPSETKRTLGAFGQPGSVVQ